MSTKIICPDFGTSSSSLGDFWAFEFNVLDTHFIYTPDRHGVTILGFMGWFSRGITNEKSYTIRCSCLYH